MNAPENEFFRTPPASIESEHAVLGALMADAAAWDKIIDVLKPEHFFRNAHRLIFAAMTRLQDRNQPIDPVSVFETLVSTRKAEEAGGMPALIELVNASISSHGIQRHAAIIVDRARLRDLMGVGNQILDLAWDEGETEEKIARSGALLDRLADGAGATDVIDLRDALRNVVDRIDELYHQTRDVVGLSCGFPDLDRRLNGMSPGELIVIAGRPSMGKSTLAFQIAAHVAIDLNLPVYAWCGEMGALQIARRLLGTVGKLDGNRLKSGKLQDQEWPRLTYAIQKMQDAQFFIDERAGIHVNQLAAKARTLKRRLGVLGVIVVDYLQLATGTGENRTGEIGSISRGLKRLAREIGCPVVVLSQLSRKPEERANKRPMLSDLRESGDIEADADVVMSIYRDDYYNPDSPDRGIAEINILKSRDGETGMCGLLFEGEHAWFGSMAQGWQSAASAAAIAPKRIRARNTGETA